MRERERERGLCWVVSCAVFFLKRKKGDVGVVEEANCAACAE